MSVFIHNLCKFFFEYAEVFFVYRKLYQGIYKLIGCLSTVNSLRLNNYFNHFAALLLEKKQHSI